MYFSRIFACFVLIGAAVGLQAVETLTLSASSTTPVVGSQVVITVGVAGAAPFAVLGEQFVYDTTKLRLDSQAAGSLATFVADSRATTDINGSAQVRSGYYYLDGSGHGANNAGGTGSVARFTLTVLAAGSTSVSVPAKSGSNPFGAVLIDAAGSERLPGVPAALTLTLQSPNQAPNVALSAPAAGATVTAPASIAITATASDSDGTVAKVEFYNGGTLLGSDTSSPYAYTWGNVAAGTYSLTAKATDNAGAVTMSAARSITVQAAVAEGTGLAAAYYDNADFTGTSVSRLDPTVNFDWASGSPATGIGADTFSARWTGQVTVPASGTWTFTTTSDDGIRLWVDGVQIINNWTNHGPTDNSGTITLSGGLRYDVRLEYYENGGGAVARLAWSGPGQAAQIVPATYLYPTVVLPTNWIGQDIGSMTPAGSSSYNAASDAFSITGAGADIWNASDAFRAVHTDISGSCDLIARVDSLQNTNAWAKAGVMLRNGLAADAQHAMMIISFSSGASFQRRVLAAGQSEHTTVAGIAAPRWVKLSRRGDVFTGYQSADGTAWTQVGQATIVMPAALKAALVVTSHQDGTPNTATISQVTLVPVQAN